MKFIDLYESLLSEDFKIVKNQILAKKNLDKGAIVGIAKFGNTVTALGKNVKKSNTPNIDIIKKNDKIFFIVTKPIKSEQELEVAPEKHPLRTKEDLTKTQEMPKITIKGNVKLGK